jgi:RNA polymerase sigma factor for flagellar operon FliA
VRIEPIDDAYSDSNLAFADDRPDSFAMLADQQARSELASAIGALPERLQLIVQLYFVEELNLHEIADTLEVSVPRVHQLKAQALEKLRGMLGEDIMLL